MFMIIIDRWIEQSQMRHLEEEKKKSKEHRILLLKDEKIINNKSFIKF